MTKAIRKARKTLETDLMSINIDKAEIAKLLDLAFPLPAAPVARKPKPIHIDMIDATAVELRQSFSEDGESTSYKLTAPHGLRKVDMDDIREALRDTFTRRCSHEFDCCGCLFGGPHSIRKQRGHVLFRVGYSRNI